MGEVRRAGAMGDLIGYGELLTQVRDEVRRARIGAARRMASESVRMYLAIGRLILDRQAEEGWGTAVIPRLAADLQAEFPSARGFSVRNLEYARTIARHFDGPIAQQLAAQLPWGHLIALSDQVPNPDQRMWYAGQAVEHGWSRNTLTTHVASALHARVSTGPLSREIPVSPTESDLVRALVKDPYRLDFAGLDPAFTERQLEDALVTRMAAFLTELGPGFAFVGRQVALRVGKTDYFLDLLFYHLGLRRYVVIELKAGPATPEAVGKLGFYLTVVDAQHRRIDYGDGPSIGILLSATRDDVVVEYALQSMGGPMAAVTYQALPDEVREQLPSPAALTQGLRRLEDAEAGYGPTESTPP